MTHSPRKVVLGSLPSTSVRRTLSCLVLLNMKPSGQEYLRRKGMMSSPYKNGDLFLNYRYLVPFFIGSSPVATLIEEAVVLPPRTAVKSDGRSTLRFLLAGDSFFFRNIDNRVNLAPLVHGSDADSFNRGNRALAEKSPANGLNPEEQSRNLLKYRTLESSG